MLRDENENFYFQSHASRREREFLLSVSFFETRISVLTLVLRDENENNVEGWLPLFLAQSIIKSGSEIRSVAVWMSERLEQCKEVVEVMTRKVVEFLETNMGMVEDNLGQVGNNLEEAWGNLVEEYFSGDNVPALQVNCPNPKTFKTHLHTEDSPSRYPHHHQPHCQHHPNL